MNITVTRSGMPPGVVAAKLPDAIQAGLRNVSLTALSLSEKKIQRIYSRAIPTVRQVEAYRNATGRHRRVWARKSGDKLAWTRTGKLRQSLDMTDANTLFSYGTRITAKRKGMYGKKGRHELGVTWQPKSPALGVIRKNPWWQEVDAELAPQVRNRFDDGFRAVLK